MVREMRIEFPGALYHVHQRGNNREHIFEHDRHKRYFYELLAASCQNLQLQVLAYVIMNNHYHLLIQTGEIPLQQIMHFINTRFSMYYNACEERTGHVFERRYGAQLIDNDHYYMTVLRYIHLNPVRAGICGHPNDYPWSSYRDYISEQTSLTNTELALSKLDDQPDRARRRFAELMEAPLEDYQFANENEAVALNKYYRDEQRHNRLQQLFLETGATLDDLNLIRAGGRTHRLTELKTNFVVQLLDEYSISELAGFLNTSRVSLYKLVKSPLDI